MVFFVRFVMLSPFMADRALSLLILINMLIIVNRKIVIYSLSIKIDYYKRLQFMKNDYNIK